jgi:tight adherence protein B
MNPIAAIPLSFLLTAGLVYAAAGARARQARQRRDRLDRVTGRSQAPPPAPSEAASADPDARRADALPTLTRWLGGAGWEPRLRLAMLQADLRLRPAEWLGVCAASGLGGALLGLLATHLLVTGLVTGLVGLTVPLLILPMRQAARRGRFDALLPDALMLLTASLRAGHSFGQAMQAVASELPAPIAEEFGWASGEARLGVPLDVALGRMTRRVPSPDLDLVVTAILIQLPLGGNLAEVLDAIADTIRERVRMAGEVQTLTAEGRLSAVVLLVLAPALALLLHLRSPDYFQPLLETLSGRWMIGGAILGQIVGGLIIRRMVALDV